MAMSVQLGHQPIGVALADRVEDPIVRVDRGASILWRVVVQRPVGLRRVPQQTDDAQRVRLCRLLEDREMKLPVGGQFGGDVAAVDGLDTACGGLLSAPERLLVERG
jgi:hypothetical protein